MSTYDRRTKTAADPIEPADLIADATKFLKPLEDLEHEVGKLINQYRDEVILRHSHYALLKERPRVLTNSFQMAWENLEKSYSMLGTTRGDIWQFIQAAKRL